MQLFLDCARADNEADERLSIKLTNAISSGLLPRRYFEHPVTRSAPAGIPVYRYSLYFDGVPFTRNDGLLACCLANA